VPQSWIRPLLLAIAGIALLQSSYVLALPPFRGADEFDHAFRAAGVADGQVRLHEGVTNGRGQLVYVPADLVRAASAQCEALPYTGFANCHPVRERADGRVGVATGAGSYNPAFYGVVGVAAAAFEGASALYAMRVTAGLLCLALVAAGLAGLMLTRRGPLVWLSALVGLTPSFVYGMGVVAPNGIEMAAGFAAWSALLSLFVGGATLSRRAETALIGAGTTACLVLVTVRTLGSLWLLLIAACVLALVGWRPVLDTVRARPRAYGAAVGLVAGGALAGLGWSMASGLTSGSAPGSDVVTTNDPSVALRWPLWTLQAVAAAPLKDDPAPAAAYLLVLVAVAGVVGGALRAATRRVRGVVLLAAVLAAVVPTALVLATLSTQGGVWQGRYVLPFACGIPLVAAWLGPTGQDARGRSRSWAALAALACLTAGHLVVAVTMQSRETRRYPSSVDDAWVHGSLASTAGLVVAGGLLLGLALLRVGRLSQAGADELVGHLRDGAGRRGADA